MQIKKVIDEHGKSWASVAKDLGKTSSAIIQIADGNPTVGKLKQLAGVIGCHWLDFFQDELEAEGLQLIKKEQQQPAPQPADGQQQQGSAADELPFTGGGDGGKRQEAERTGGGQPTATVQQAIICPHCKRAIAITVNGI